VLHRDIKPANLLVNAQCDLKVCDFGLARIVEGESRAQPDGLSTLTEYVVTRWYRAPEIMLCCDEYGPAIDVWAIGCVFGEMLLRKAVFAGQDYLQQLGMIAEGIRMPAMDQIEGFVKNEQALSFLRKLPKEGTRLIEDRLQRAQDAGRGVECSDQGMDLLMRMLAFDPRERITIDEAMAHPYLAELHSQRWPDEEDVKTGPESGPEKEPAIATKNQQEEDTMVQQFDDSIDSISSSESPQERPQSHSPQQPQSERNSRSTDNRSARRVVRANKGSKVNKVGPSPHHHADQVRPFGSTKKPSLLDHPDFHFEKLGPLGREELQEIMMGEIDRFYNMHSA